MSDVDVVVRAKAKSLGFDAVGVALADAPLDRDYVRYESFLRSGFHGNMGYLEANREVRRGLAGPGILPGARSVICVAQRYAVRGTRDEAGGVVERIAKYARGRDYHNHVRRRLRKLAEFVRELEAGATARPLVDTAPVLERAWAARAGLGFVGKNGMLIRPGLGSYTVIGEVVTTVALTPDRPMESRCGRCTACLDACPTSAFVEPYVLDARRCVSYLTIEHRGAWRDELTGTFASGVFGCDKCQDVCPFNRGKAAWIEPGGPFDAFPRWRSATLGSLLAAPSEAFARLVEGSPIRRVSRDDWRRNVIASLSRDEVSDWVVELQRVAEDASSPAWLRAMARRAVASVKPPGQGDRS